MKITVERIAILVLGIIIIVFLLRDCARPSEQREADRKEMYETEVAILKAEKTSIQAAQDSIGKVLIQRTRKDSLSLMRYNAEITVLKKKVIIKRVYVQPLIDSIPTLRAFVELQDSLIQHHEARIDSLNAGMEFQRKLNEDLIITEFQEDKVEQQMIVEYETRIAEMNKVIRKKERGKKGWKILAVVGTVLGIVGGSQL